MTVIFFKFIKAELIIRRKVGILFFECPLIAFIKYLFSIFYKTKKPFKRRV